jgi:hypothetical protein
MCALKRTLEPASRYSDNVSGPLPTSNVVLPNCVHRPVHQVGISMPRDATDRPLRVSRSSSREKFLNCAVLGSATKMRQTRPPFDENSANALVDTSPSATRIGNLRRHGRQARVLRAAGGLRRVALAVGHHLRFSGTPASRKTSCIASKNVRCPRRTSLR